ncbi:MAG: hypothetical protein JJE13_03610 [Thermoleophilia bacterium]|nr:hypothetical protein [Thermoleophilia bacterium]
MAHQANLWNFALGCALLVVSVALFVFSWGALSNLFSEYQDSPSGTYVAIGGLFVVLALGSAVCGIALLRMALKRE